MALRLLFSFLILIFFFSVVDLLWAVLEFSSTKSVVVFKVFHLVLLASALG